MECYATLACQCCLEEQDTIAGKNQGALLVLIRTVSSEMIEDKQVLLKYFDQHFLYSTVHSMCFLLTLAIEFKIVLPPPPMNY